MPVQQSCEMLFTKRADKLHEPITCIWYCEEGNVWYRGIYQLVPGFFSHSRVGDSYARLPTFRKNAVIWTSGYRKRKLTGRLVVQQLSLMAFLAFLLAAPQWPACIPALDSRSFSVSIRKQHLCNRLWNVSRLLSDLFTRFSKTVTCYHWLFGRIYYNRFTLLYLLFPRNLFFSSLQQDLVIFFYSSFKYINFIMFHRSIILFLFLLSPSRFYFARFWVLDHIRWKISRQVCHSLYVLSTIRKCSSSYWLPVTTIDAYRFHISSPGLPCKGEKKMRNGKGKSRRWNGKI